VGDMKASTTKKMTKVELQDALSGIEKRLDRLKRTNGRQKEELKELRVMLEAFQCSGQPFILADQDNIILDVNDPFIELLKGKKKDYKGTHMLDLLTARSRNDHQKEIEITMGELGAWQGEVFCRKKGKKSFPASLKINAFKGKNGKVKYNIATILDISSFKDAEMLLQQQAHFDPLTELPNRTLMFDRFSQALRMAKRYGHIIAVMLIDLDRFKEVNDTLGHDIGDQLLIETSKRLTYTIRESDTVARMGGDEFFVILPEIGSANDAAHIAQKFLNILSAPFLLSGNELFISASIGISMFPNDSDDPDKLVKKADTAMYHAKAQGKNNFKFFTEDINKSTVERFILETQFRQALDKLEFHMNYQPKVDIRSGIITGTEALLRWYHPEQGNVKPGLFIPLAEETGFVVQLGEWALRESCRQNKEWQDKGLRPLRVSVNLSPRQFKKRDLLEMVKGVLDETGLDPQYLMLEITESTIMENIEETIGTMNSFRDLGVGISIDDFGTGYSSLNYLNRFSVDELKVDQTFISQLSDADNCKVVNAVIALAHELNHKVVAEGVETDEQLEFLRSNNCDEVQGYFFSKPLSAKDFHALLSEDPTYIK
jgi:diguanylate cyclase (GGDEF)-like protein/PAS domain S-box-containing protein